MGSARLFPLTPISLSLGEGEGRVRVAMRYIVLNPLDWSVGQLELLAEKVLPLVARP